MTAASGTVKTTLCVNDYRVDIYTKLDRDPAEYHYIVTQRTSADILGWGQAETMEACRREAVLVVQYLSEHNQEQAG
jgi:hypothetical protein